VAAIQGALAECLGATSARSVVVLRAPPLVKPCGRVKDGVHLVAPHLCVTTEQCLVVRAAAMARLPAVEGLAELRDGWEDAFDASVYRGSGFRMLGSRKMEVCACRRAASTPLPALALAPPLAPVLPICTVCNGTGRCDQGRAYAVSQFVGPSGVPDDAALARLLRNPALALRLCSTRRFRAPAAPFATGFQPRPGAVAGGLTPGTGAGGPTQGTGAGAPLPPNQLASLAPALALASRIHPRFSGLVCSSARGNASVGYILRVRGLRFCANIDREYSQSEAYFTLSPAGQLVQRCFCPKYACTAYRGKVVQLDARIARRCGLTDRQGWPAAFAARSARLRGIGTT